MVLMANTGSCDLMNQIITTGPINYDGWKYFRWLQDLGLYETVAIILGPYNISVKYDD